MTLVEALATLIALSGLTAAALALVATHSVLLALAILFDFLLAVGLLRLAGESSWPGLGQAAAIVALRHVIRAGIDRGELGRQRPAG